MCVYVTTCIKGICHCLLVKKRLNTYGISAVQFLHNYVQYFDVFWGS